MFCFHGGQPELKLRAAGFGRSAGGPGVKISPVSFDLLRHLEDLVRIEVNAHHLPPSLAVNKKGNLGDSTDGSIAPARSDIRIGAGEDRAAPIPPLFPGPRPLTSRFKNKGPYKYYPESTANFQAFLAGSFYFRQASWSENFSPASQKIIGSPYLFGTSGGWAEKKMSA
jgi:hypothetical protein